MAAPKSPRKGSLQFWPRKRAKKVLPRVNWNVIPTGSVKNLKGFIAYKAGMTSALVKDKTQNSMTKDKEIIIPATILECPPLKIFSVRFYKNNQLVKEILAGQLDKELKRTVKLPKKTPEKIDNIKLEEYDDISIIVYSQPKKIGIKKRPDLEEIGLAGSFDEKISFVKENLNKEISIFDVFNGWQIADLRGLTKGKGFSGPVKRFGIKLRFHKTEKGQRKVGSIGPWHPARVTFRVPMAGQMGMFTRVHYNQKIISLGKNPKNDNEKLKNIKNYGDIKSDYILIAGSVQGPAKRQLLITAPLRGSKDQLKKNYEFLELK
ncbi:MAG TPA: 50S ribosomal protein L3 [Candidatus Nanoarchaeia archaeon]|nr:50S ribosomal protein L3 [Candidatus Nanoarchaeia archaeon]